MEGGRILPLRSFSYTMTEASDTQEFQPKFPYGIVLRTGKRTPPARGAGQKSLLLMAKSMLGRISQLLINFRS